MDTKRIHSTSLKIDMYLGIDFGTSGCRACIIDDHEQIVYETSQSLPAPIVSKTTITQDPELWWQALLNVFKTIKHNFSISSISDICINGTSATVVHCLKNGQVLSPALMYNDQSSINELDAIKAIAPLDHVTLSASSALSKMRVLHRQNSIPDSFMLNQADWLSNRLCGHVGHSDYNNALKMGYDVKTDSWPDWMHPLIPTHLLPQVHAPGYVLGPLTSDLSHQFGFRSNVNIRLGTTDSIAAFIATGVKSSDTAVTSLGSTLVLKVLSKQPIESSEFGIYSHKLGRFWLAGGASNSGGKVLSEFFSNDELVSLSHSINPDLKCDLNYYPLPNMGERFPINDSNKQPELTPRPDDDALFLNGLFEGIANIEQLGYQRLMNLGATYPKNILSCGGGATNKIWQSIRQRVIKADVQTAVHSQACYGSALLAKNGITNYL